MVQQQLSWVCRKLQKAQSALTQQQGHADELRHDIQHLTAASTATAARLQAVQDEIDGIGAAGGQQTEGEWMV